MAILYILLFILIMVFGSCTNPGSGSENNLPNFLFLVADDAGWQDFGCYGNPHIQTPHIDSLAAAGIKANTAFLTAPQCSPSRISVLTGKYAHSTGAEDLHMPMPSTEKTLPVYLKEKNYFSGYLKKGHLGPHGEGQFDWSSKELGDFNVFLDSVKTLPFFMWVGFTDPHRPYQEDIIENGQSAENVVVPPYLVDDAATRQDLAHYYNEIRRMDQRIGIYIDALRRRDLLENTVIFFISDNGAPFPRAKGTLYDAGIRTPLIISWPAAFGKNLEYAGLTSVIDLAPTVLDMADIKIPEVLQGESMYGKLLDPALPGRNYVYSERNWHNCDEHMRSVRTQDFKFITNAYTSLPHGTAADITSSPSWKSLRVLKDSNGLTKAQSLLFQVPRPEEELYDLRNDPYELHNLLNNTGYSETANELREALKKWQLSTGDFSPDQRRRKDNTDRFSGIKFDMTRLPARP